MSAKLVMSAAGDLVIRNRLYGEDGPRHAGYERTLDYLRAGDIVWGSCEVQFSRQGYRTDAPIAYLVDPAVAGDLGKAGYNLMTVATNHTCDFGPQAFMDTLSHLHAAGVETVGGGKDIDAALAPSIREVNGTRVGFLAVSCLLPPDYAATAGRPGIAPLRVEQWPEIDPILLATEPGAPMKMRSRIIAEDMDRLTQQIKDLRPKVDVLIVSVHWGYGKGNPQAEYQRPLGHAIIEAGADMVLGNHPHSPAGVETYQGRPILYSLGNHVAQQDWDNATPVQQDIFSQIDPWSMVCHIHIGANRIEAMEFQATQCDREGMPNLIEDVAVAQPVLAGFQSLSAKMASTVTIDGLKAFVRFP